MASPGRSASALASSTSAPATSHDPAAARSAALRGATLAFEAQKTAADTAKPAPRTPNPTTRRKGALLAATQASREGGSPRESSPANVSRGNNDRSRDISRHDTGGSAQDAGVYGSELGPRAVTQRLSQYLGSSPTSTHFLLPGGKSGMDPRSTSFIAATLAASRSASPTPSHTGRASPHPAAGQSPLSARPRRRRSFGASSVDSSATSPDTLDASPIPAATSLISMFENKTDTDPVKKSDPSPGQRLAARPKLRPPTPPRSLSPRRPEAARHISPVAAPKPPPKPKSIQAQRPATPPQIIRRAATEMASPEPLRIGPKPNLQPPRLPARSSSSLSQAPVNDPNARRTRPITPNKEPKPPTNKQDVRVARPATPSSPDSASTDDTFVSASSAHSPRPSSPVMAERDPEADARPSSRPARQRSSPVRQILSVYSNSHRPERSPNRSTTTVDSASSLPLDSLTDAIMAGSLAAARATPTIASSRDSSAPPVPPPRRSGHHLNLHPHHPLHLQQHTGDGQHRRRGSNSPQRRTGMLQTLRQPPSKSDDEDENARRRTRRRRRKKALGGNKHSHQEGARKRWRDEVSARQKRRYEAVWASNRGLFLSGPPGGGDEEEEEEDLVVNVVVRDIWSRSRLPADELAEVWDLVDRRGAGALDKQEFVVGMWLIDQRLRGRKIPARVGDSVWDSARGVRVTGPRPRR